MDQINRSKFGEISVFLNGEFEMIFDKGSLSLGLHNI